ncbi:ABC transporter permease [Oceanobacillus polygoni]|uniref:ABC-2 type transport system permease protein n=1 Tax=Oceanobacillus polygoni TaxID=1235259 RepID=A0A9X0YVN5_9BACI|nr:ABC transporter permease [Oceanobacillus polygoni]MBP2079533.1 ABC-2 type transport system permease protein [Oceanobacillus polygoni]
MRSFLRKDLLVFWRDRKEVLISLLAPILLIVVLNFAFSDLFGEDAETLDIDLGIVMEDDESLGLEQFTETVSEMDLSEVEKGAMIEQASTISPSGLMTSFFSDPELSGWITTKQISEQDAKEQVANGELDAFVKIPEGFTNDVLRKIMLDQSAETALVLQIEEQSTESDTIHSIISNYLDTLNFQFALQGVTDGELIEHILPEGGREVVDGAESFGISQYFTVAMSFLFALFIASTVAMKTTTEKRERVFNRIILTNTNPISFLMGKTISTFCFAWLQLMIVFSVCHLLLDVFEGKSMAFWIGVIVIITFFSLAVAGLSAVFTTFTLNLNNTDAANGAFNLVIMLLAAVGGNLFPIHGLPEWLQKIGEWTPNGLSLSVFMQWTQFGDLQTLMIPMVKLFVFFIGCLLIGIFLFPRRGRA